MDLEARVHIADLMATYASAVDRRDYAQLADTFAEEGRLVVPGTAEQPDAARTITGGGAIAAHVQRLHASYAATFHVLGQQAIQVDGDRAAGETYCIAHHLFDHASRRLDRVLHLRYGDAFVRVDGSWRFAERRVAIDILDYRPVASEPSAS